MMLGFIILFTLMVALLVIPALVGSRRSDLFEIENSFATRQHQLKSDYQFRRKELARRYKIADIDAEELSQLQDELDRETASSIQHAKIKSNSGIFNPSLLFGLLLTGSIVAASFYTYLYVGNPELAAERSKLLDMLAQNPNTIEYLSEQAKTQKNRQSALELLHAARLLIEVKPFAPSSWLQYGEVEASFGRIDQAVIAFRRARQLDPENNQIKLALSRALLSVEGKAAPVEAMLLEKDVLRSDPNNRQALLSLGFSAFQAEEYQQAIDAWEKVLEFKQTTPERAQILHKTIATAKARLAATQPNGQVSTKAANSATIKTTMEQPTKPASIVLASLQVNVAISEEVQAKLTGNETLFVFAKAASGPPIPLAVARFPINQIPKQITLSDKDAMRPDLKLSSFKKVKVMARISVSGNALAKAGDFEGNTTLITAPYTNQIIEISIDHQL